MCTVSWARRPNGYSLFFNRDESRERPVGLPPEIIETNSIGYVCPRDPVGGGTWLLVNQYGLSLGLLNYYEAQMDYQPENPESRGRLPIQFVSCRDTADVKTAINKTDLSRYPPFHLLGVDRNVEAVLVTWNGVTVRTHYPEIEDLPISTSSFKTDEVIAARKQLFKETTRAKLSEDHALDQFHTSKRPTPDTHAVLMTRPNARTVSITHVKVEKDRAWLNYRARPEDSNALDPPVQKSIELS